jgi:hypothetical protein
MKKLILMRQSVKKEDFCTDFIFFDVAVLEWRRRRRRGKEIPLIMTAVKKEPKPSGDVQTAVYMLLYV